MEERFDQMRCLNCGKEMHKGITHKGQRPHLMWYPGRKEPTHLDLIRLPNAEGCEDISKGVLFDDILDWFSISYRPSWYCHDCGLLLIDTKETLGKA